MVIIVVSYIALGCVAGVIAGLLGLGGGIVIVPILNYSLPYFGVTEDVQRLALGTSMASIIFTSLSSVRAHAGHGAVLWGVVKRLTPGIIAGTALGGTLAAHVPVQVLTGIFVVFLFYVGTQIFLNIKPKPTRCLPGTAGMIGVGGGIGLMSSFVGIGGGTLTVPFLSMCNVDMRQAIGTSAGGGMPIAVFGSLSYIANGWGMPHLPEWALGYIYLPALLGLVIGSMATAPLGCKLAYKISITKLKRIFALFIYAVALNMAWKAFF